jgi:RNA polymerase sigma factor (sigma-70 family)
VTWWKWVFDGIGAGAVLGLVSWGHTLWRARRKPEDGGGSSVDGQGVNISVNRSRVRDITVRHDISPDAIQALADAIAPRLIEASSPSARAPGADADREAEFAMELLRYNIAKEIAALPERERIVFVFRYYEGLSNRQIADLLGSSAIAVDDLARDGLLTLQAKFGNFDPRDL